MVARQPPPTDSHPVGGPGTDTLVLAVFTLFICLAVVALSGAAVLHSRRDPTQGTVSRALQRVPQGRARSVGLLVVLLGGLGVALALVVAGTLVVAALALRAVLVG